MNAGRIGRPERHEQKRTRTFPSQETNQMRELGIAFWNGDADSYTYPVKTIPCDPKDATDPKLMQICDDRGYSYADIITVHPDNLPR